MRASGLAVLCASGLLSALLGACGSSGQRPAAAGTTTTTAPPTATTAPSGTLTVAVTPDASAVWAIAAPAIEAAAPDLHLQVDDVAATSLATAAGQSVTGLLISSDEAALTQLQQNGAAYQPVPFARTWLQIVVAPTDPKGIKALTDLEKPGVRTVLLEADQLAGQTSQRLLGANGLTVTTVAPAASPAQAVADIDTGRADASLLDVEQAAAAGANVRTFDIPTSDNVVTTYYLAFPKGAPSALAQTVAQSLLEGAASQALTADRYLLPAPSTPSGTSSAGGGT
jgi:molybdate transport system substrate-binding protein